MTRKTFLTATATVVTTVESLGAAPPKEWSVFEGATGKPLRYSELAARLAPANAIFLGEQHDDPETHRVEAAVLQEIHTIVGPKLTLALEMFERDGQAALDAYLTGKTDEATLAKSVKLWPNYQTDYRPLIEFAKANRVPVLASNAPAGIVRRVGQEGLDTLAKLTPGERAHVAPFVLAPSGDEYARRFADVISDGHGDGAQMPPATIRRFYEAQCTRDDTMAQTVVNALNAGRMVLHVNGAFHSDAGLGTAARVLWRRPVGTVVRVVKIIAQNEAPNPSKFQGEADYLVFVPDKGNTKKS